MAEASSSHTLGNFIGDKYNTPVGKFSTTASWVALPGATPIWTKIEEE